MHIPQRNGAAGCGGRWHVAGMEYASVFCMGNGLLFGAGAGWFMGDGGRGRVTSIIFDEWQVNTTACSRRIVCGCILRDAMRIQPATMYE